MSSSSKSETKDPMGINDLSDKILFKIFEIIFQNCKDNDYKWIYHKSGPTFNDLMLVCKKWKQLIEKFNIFECSKVFVKPRRAQEYQLAANSKRKYRSMWIFGHEKDHQQFESLQSIFKESGESIKSIYLILKCENPGHEISLNYFFSLMKLFENCHGIKILIQKIEENSEQSKSVPEIPSIILKKLKYLKIESPSPNFNYLDFMAVPELQIFNLKVSHNDNTNELNHVFNFINKNSMRLKEVFIDPHNNFEWNSEFLMLKNCDYFADQLEIFFRDNLGKLKYLFLSECRDSKILDILLKKTNHLEYLNIESDVFNQLDQEEHSFPLVKHLVIHNYDFADIENGAQKIRNSFPNIEIIHFYYPIGDLVDHIEVFQLMLPDIEIYLDFDN